MKRSSVRRGLGATLRDLAASAPLARAVPHVLRHGADVSGVVAAGARRFGDRVAVVDRWGELGYRELDAMVSHAASTLPAGQRIGVSCGDDRWLLVAVAAAIRAGSDAVLIGSGTGASELESVLARERISLVIRSGDAGLDVSRLAAVSSTGRGQLVLLTSGTTGEPTAPRRARLNPLAIASLLASAGLRTGEPVLVLPPLHHGHGFSLATACLIVGAPLLIGAGLPLDEAMVLAGRANVLSGVPTQLSRLAGHPRARSLSPRRIVSGSGRLSPTLASRLNDLYGPVLIDCYGSTATGTVAIATADDLSASPGTVGRPVAGVRIRVLDGDGRSCPRGTVGVVHAASRATGDLGWMDAAGRLHLAGRADGLVVSGGENISAAEVEDYLAAQPEVDDVHVRAVPDEEFGAVLAARVVLRSGDAASLRDRVKRDLGRHKAPRIDVVDAIERTATGKVRLVE